MSLKTSNELTVKIKCELNELYKILENKGFEMLEEFTMADTYMIPKSFEFAIKDIKNGDNLIEFETDEEKFDTIEKVKEKIEKIQIPIYTDNFFVKKAEIELNKILGRN